jgi:arylsulfatase
MMGLASGVSVGQDSGAPVTDEYKPPYAFTGTVHRVVYDVSGEAVVDHEAEIRIALARQ